MQTEALLRSRSAELRLDESEIEELAQLLDPDIVTAVLATLLRYEEALTELAR